MNLVCARPALSIRYRYRAFGARTDISGIAPARQDPSFQNRTLDAGLGIYDYRNRSFDPATGRFLQRDPKLGGDPMFNPYCFPRTNPVTGSDPMGESWVWRHGEWNEFGKDWCPRPLRKGAYEGEIVRGIDWAYSRTIPFPDEVIESHVKASGFFGRLGLWCGVGQTYSDVWEMQYTNTLWKSREARAPVPDVMKPLSEVITMGETGVRGAVEPVTGVVDITTNAVAAATGRDVSTEWSLAFGDGGALDQQLAVERALKREGEGPVKSYLISGFYGSADFYGATNYYDAGTANTNVFGRGELVGVRELSPEECSQQAYMGLLKNVRVVGIAGGTLCVVDRLRARAPRIQVDPLMEESRSPSLTGKRLSEVRGVELTDRMSRAQFGKLLRDVELKGFLNREVEVVHIGGKTYVVRGSNRVAAARRLGKTQDLILKEVDLPFLGYKSEDSVIRSAAEVTSTGALR